MERKNVMTWLLYCVSLLLTVSGCDKGPTVLVDLTDNPRVVDRRTLKASGGGRVDWSKANNLIAYDTVDDQGRWQINTIKPDGSDDICLTCDVTGLPAGAKLGQPAWHPSGDWLVIQVENLDLSYTSFALGYLSGAGWGINNDLWLIPAQGGAAQKLDGAAIGQQGEASLHPHFSDDGESLFWTRRDPTDKDTNILKGFNWFGWYMAVAPFSISNGVATVGTVQDIFRDGPSEERGFYESHQLRENTLWFSRTVAPSIGINAFVDEGFNAPLNSPASMQNVTAGEGYWEEHGVESPGGDWITFNSSRIAPDVAYPPNIFASLSMGIYIRPRDLSEPADLLIDSRHLMTDDEIEDGYGIVTSDYDWSPDGTEIVTYSAKRNGTGVITTQTIEIVTLDRAY